MSRIFLTSVLVVALAFFAIAEEPTKPVLVDKGGSMQNFDNPAELTEPNSPAKPENDIEGSGSKEDEQQQIEDNTLNPLCGEIFNEEIINSQGLVDYAYLRRHRSGLYALTRKFASLEVSEYIDWELEDQVAFWVNAHNLFTLELIVDNYPIEPSRIRMIFYPANSIMQIAGARNSIYFNIMGREYSLEEMEKNILDLYKDPRVLFALNYASVGSAPLRSEPYLGSTLEYQLDNQARRFLGRRTGFFLQGSQLQLSPIFDWNIDAFVEVYGIETRYRAHPPQTRALINFIEQYKGTGWGRILDSDRFRIRYQRFDWRLNEK